MVESDSSPNRLTWSSGTVLHTLTATRGQAGGPLVVNRGRRMDCDELSWTLGVDFANDIQPSGLVGKSKTSCISERQWGHALGNANSLGVAERFLRAGLISARIIEESDVQDRWALPGGSIGPCW